MPTDPTPRTAGETLEALREELARLASDHAMQQIEIRRLRSVVATERDRAASLADDRDEAEEDMGEMIDAIARLTERNRKLEEALRPFAAFDCDEPHIDEPECHNCRAARLLTDTEPTDAAPEA